MPPKGRVQKKRESQHRNNAASVRRSSESVYRRASIRNMLTNEQSQSPLTTLMRNIDEGHYLSDKYFFEWWIVWPLRLKWLLSCDAMLARYMLSCLSVRLSQASTVPKWLNVGSHKQRHNIAQDSSFWCQKSRRKFEQGDSLWLLQIQVG